MTAPFVSSPGEAQILFCGRSHSLVTPRDYWGKLRGLKNNIGP